jgi:hypothetical protein
MPIYIKLRRLYFMSSTLSNTKRVQKSTAQKECYKNYVSHKTRSSETAAGKRNEVRQTQRVWLLDLSYTRAWVRYSTHYHPSSLTDKTVIWKRKHSFCTSLVCFMKDLSSVSCRRAIPNCSCLLAHNTGRKSSNIHVDLRNKQSALLLNSLMFH